MRRSAKKLVDASTQTDEIDVDALEKWAANYRSPRSKNPPPATTAPRDLPFHPRRQAPVPHERARPPTMAPKDLPFHPRRQAPVPHGMAGPAPKPPITGARAQPPAARPVPARPTAPAAAPQPTMSAPPSTPPPRRPRGTAQFWRAPPKRIVEDFDKPALPVDKEEFAQDTKRLGLRVGLHRSRHA